MTTGRLYYDDSYLREFRATVVDRSPDGCRLYLDRTAFYPSSGGQPHDTGLLGGSPVVDVIDEGERIAHITASPSHGSEVEGRIDWGRRFDHMQQHTGQHLLSAVLIEQCGLQTVSFHLGEEASTIDVEAASVSAEQLAAAERRANEVMIENRTVTGGFEEASEAEGLRRASERAGPLRIVSIEGLDRSACGGTHVRATGEIGPIFIRKLERIRGNVRLEFLCGFRALRRARADFEALSAVARVFSSQLDQAPALAAVQAEALQKAEKARRRIAAELARYQGRELYDATPLGPDGIRRAVRGLPGGSIDDEARAFAQGFTAQPKCSLLMVIDDPPALLLAVSGDAGINAGEAVKSAVSRHGGRGGGSALIAQGSVPSKEALAAIRAELSEI